MGMESLLGSAVESRQRVSPSRVRGSRTSSGKAEVFAGLTRWVVALKCRQLHLTGRFHPAQTLQVGEVGDKAMVATAIGLIGSTGQVSLVETAYVVGIDRAFLLSGLPCLGIGSSIHG